MNISKETFDKLCELVESIKDDANSEPDMLERIGDKDAIRLLGLAYKAWRQKMLETSKLLEELQTGNYVDARGVISL